MPKLRAEDVAGLDIDELEAAEYNEDYVSYSGEVPPADTVLGGYVKSMWWTYTQNDDPMLVVLWVADENEGKLEKYNGLPCWERLALTTGAKFKWAPFLNHFGIALRDVKTKTIVGAEDESFGAPITKIGAFVPGSDDAWCRVVTTREQYNDKWQAHVRSWLDYDEDEAAEEPDDEVDEVDEPEDYQEDEDAEEAEEAEKAPPARGRRTAGKPAKTPAASKPAAPGRRAAPSRSARPAAKASAAPKRGRRAAAGSDDDPPF